VGLTYVDAPVNYLADLSVKPVTYNPPPGTGVPRREGNYQNFVVRVHNARPYADDLSLDRQAFILTKHDTQVRDFYDEQELKTAYYKEVEISSNARPVRPRSWCSTTPCAPPIAPSSADCARRCAACTTTTRRIRPQRVRDLLPRTRPRRA